MAWAGQEQGTAIVLLALAARRSAVAEARRCWGVVERIVLMGSSAPMGIAKVGRLVLCARVHEVAALAGGVASA